MYTPEMGIEISTQYAGGTSLREIAAQDGMPDKSTIIRWSLDKAHPFYDLYARAQEIRAELDAEDLLEIADDGRNDWMERRNKEGEIVGWAENGESVRRSTLRVDARKWLISKRQPRRYGDKTQLTNSEGDGPAEIIVRRVGSNKE